MGGLEFVRNLLLYSSFGFVGIIILGFFRPAYVIWWEEIQNRRRVLKTYGRLLLIFMIGYLILMAL